MKQIAINGPQLRIALGNLSSYKDEIWITHDGRHIPVGQMHEAHVRNALRMVIRQESAKRAKLRAQWSKELARAKMLDFLHRQLDEIQGEDRKWGV
jgi:hypothetical protein